jgi:metal-responsive CopG/Arc/MetJ family transcriptional regulator
MPKVRKTGYTNFNISLPDDVVAMIDSYAAINELKTRSSAITDICRHFFTSNGGLSPAMQATVKRKVEKVDMVSLAAQFDLSKTDRELADSIINQLRPEFEHTIANLRAFITRMLRGEDSAERKEN